MSTRNRISKIQPDILKFLSVPLMVALWWVVAQKLGGYRLPSPEEVFAKFFPFLVYWKPLAAYGLGTSGIKPHLIYTTWRTISGGATGMALGIAVGLLMSWSKPFRDVLELPLEAIRTVPPLAAIPFFIMWFGPGPISQFWLLAFYGFLGMVIYTVEAVRNVPPVYARFARSLGATEAQIFRTVVLPAILPKLTGGLRVSIAGVWGMELIAEMIGSPKGMGQVFLYDFSVSAVDLMIVSVLWVGILAYLTDLIFRTVFGYVNRWMPKEGL
jgi:ABC-type nitrate/sulfonate/bicarbonate transport system permease component